MQNTRIISDNVFWVGANDYRLEKFENLFPLDKGVAYNSYLILDEKTALIDGVDLSVSKQYIDNVVGILDGRDLDYLIINHMEPDHSASIVDVIKLYPNVTIVANNKTFDFFKQFNNIDIENQKLVVAENSQLPLGKHNLSFFLTPMVHWPEVMVTYESTDKILFSADAFGSFDSNDATFDDSQIITTEYVNSMRRYYTNIVGKYGVQVTNAIKKLSTLKIDTICPLHGIIWRNHIDFLLEKYNLWSSYTPEDQDVLILYASMYGNTKNAVSIIANKLSSYGKKVEIFDTSLTDVSFLVANSFKHKFIVLASVTYNGGLYPTMLNYLNDISALNLCNRNFGLIENGTWAPMSNKIMQNIISTMRNCEIKATFSIKSSLKPTDNEKLDEFVKQLLEINE